MEDGLDLILRLQAEEPIAKEIIKDAVSTDGLNASPQEIIIVLAPVFIRQSIEGFIDLDEFCMGGFIIWIVFRVVLQSQFPVSILNVLQCGSLLQTQHFVVVGS